MESNPNAEAFFDAIMTGEFPFMDGLFRKAESEENEWREYKGASFLGEPRRMGSESEAAFDPREHMKAIWSETLSAFGNTGGGVMVWGIDCPGKMPLGFSLAPNCQKWRDDLRDLGIAATDPMVQGVRLESLPSPTNPESGVIVCYVPPSDFPPHRAEWAGKHYYIRNQDKSVVCPTGLLRNLFYPRKRAQLALNVCGSAKHQILCLEVKLFNRGPATAESVVMGIYGEIERLLECTTSSVWEGQDATNVKRCGWPIPPQLMLPGAMKLTFLRLEPLRLQFNLHAHDNPLQVAVLAISAEEVATMKEGKAVRWRIDGATTDWQQP